MLLDRRASPVRRAFYGSGIVALAFAFAGAVDLLDKPFGYDFAAYVIAARRLVGGAEIYPPDPVLGPFGRFFNPPIVAVAFVPLALFPYAGAVIWMLALLAVAAGFGWSLTREHGLERRPWVAAGFVFFPPLLWDLSLGNVTMLAVVLALVAWKMRERPLISGALLAASIALKPVSATLLIYLLTSGRHRVVASAFALAAASIGVTWPWLGGHWISYARLLTALGSAAPGRDSNIIPPELYGSPERWLLPLLAVCVAFIAARCATRMKDEGHAFRLTLAAGPLISSTVWYPYLVAALPLLLARASPTTAGWADRSATIARVYLWAVLVAQFVRSPGLTVQLLGLLGLVLLGLIPVWRSMRTYRRPAG